MDNSYFNRITGNQFLDAEMDNVSIESGTTLFEQGERLKYIYFVINGELNVLKDGQIVWRASENEFVGISSFFIGDPNYSYEVRAKKNSQIIKLPLRLFAKAVDNCSSLNHSLMKSFCERIKITLDKVVSFSGQSKKGRRRFVV